MNIVTLSRRSTGVLFGGVSVFGGVVALVILILTIQVGAFSSVDRSVLSLTAGVISILASAPLLAMSGPWKLSGKWIPALTILLYVVSLNAWNLAFDELFARVLAWVGSEGEFNYKELLYAHLVDEGGGVPVFGIGANALLAWSLLSLNSGAVLKITAVACGACCLLFLLACAQLLGWFAI
jgi:hypothetical protein